MNAQPEEAGSRAPRLAARDAWALSAVVLAMSALLAWSAQRTFDFFDMSGFLDAGYRVARGQRIYVDFFYNAGPVHPYIHALSFKLFGFGKTAILAHLLVVNALATTVAYVLARRRLSVLLAALGALLASLCFAGPTSHPWYDQNASLFLLLAVLVVEVGLPLREAVEPVAAGLVCGVLLALSFFTKANVGAAGAVVIGGALIASGRGFRSLAGYVAGGALGTAAVLAPLGGGSEFVRQTFMAYGVGKRLLELGKLGVVFAQGPYAFVMLASLLVAIFGAEVRRQLLSWTLLMGLLAVSIFATWTGSMMIDSNLMLLGFEVIILARLVASLPSGAPGTRTGLVRRASIGLTAAVAVVAFTLAAVLTATLGTWSWRPLGWEGDYAMTNAPLRGWHAATRYGRGVDEAAAFVSRYVPAKESLFVFPDATVLYAITGRDSYRKAPFIFHAGQLLRGPYFDAFREHFLAEPPKWILYHDIAGEVPFADPGVLLGWLRLDDFVVRNYVRVSRVTGFSVLRLKDGAPAR